GFAPVAGRPSAGVASEVVVEIAVAQAQIRRKRNADAHPVQTRDQSRLEYPIGIAVIRARALVFESAVRPAKIEPGKNACGADGGSHGDDARPVAAEFREVGFQVLVVGGLRADFPAWPRGERIGLRRRLSERRGGNYKEERRACEDRFHSCSFAMWTRACSSSRLDQPSILRHVPDGVPRLAEGLA